MGGKTKIDPCDFQEMYQGFPSECSDWSMHAKLGARGCVRGANRWSVMSNREWRYDVNQGGRV